MKNKIQPFDGLLKDADPEIRSIFEAFHAQCMKVANMLETEFGTKQTIIKQTMLSSNFAEESKVSDDSDGNSRGFN